MPQAAVVPHGPPTHLRDTRVQSVFRPHASMSPEIALLCTPYSVHVRFDNMEALSQPD